MSAIFFARDQPFIRRSISFDTGGKRLRPDKLYREPVGCESFDFAMLMLGDAAFKIVRMADIESAAAAMQHIGPKCHAVRL